MLARTFSLWPGQNFRGQVGKAYVAFQHDRPTVETNAAADTVSIMTHW